MTGTLFSGTGTSNKGKGWTVAKLGEHGKQIENLSNLMMLGLAVLFVMTATLVVTVFIFLYDVARDRIDRDNETIQKIDQLNAKLDGGAQVQLNELIDKFSALKKNNPYLR